MLMMKGKIKENAQNKLRKSHIYFSQMFTCYVTNLVKNMWRHSLSY